MNIDYITQSLNKIDVKYYKYTAEISSTSCSICKKNDNIIFRSGDPDIPILPLHPNCKCKLILITDEQVIDSLNITFAKKDCQLFLKSNKFEGFTKERFEELDIIIASLVVDFNNNKSTWVGCTNEQANKIDDISPLFLKSFFIQESGGSPTAWRCDPGQANVPGDWDDEKTKLGLTKNTKSNEGDLYTNAKAALIILARKGFGASIKPTAGRRETAYFNGWTVALHRYNSNPKMHGNREHYKIYAERIIQRANNPQIYVPIEIR